MADGIPFCVCKSGFAGLQCEHSRHDLAYAQHFGLGDCFLQGSDTPGGSAVVICSNETVSRVLTHVWYGGQMYARIGNETEATTVKSEYDYFG